jgi:CheY-like chemotaxis protein
VVKQNKGNIWVYSEPGKGTTFKVYLPVVEEKAPANQLTEAKPEVKGGDETILVVEDEEVIRELAREVLGQKGYHILTARHGADALVVSEQHKGPIHLLLTDVIMPGMSGKDLAEQLLALRSNLKATYMSGYADAAIFQNGRVPESASYLQKPFTPDSLLRKVRGVLDESE